MEYIFINFLKIDQLIFIQVYDKVVISIYNMKKWIQIRNLSFRKNKIKM